MSGETTDDLTLRPATDLQYFGNANPTESRYTRVPPLIIEWYFNASVIHVIFAVFFHPRY